MASKWATEKAEAVNLDLNIGLYRDEVDAFAAALDAARQEGKREMREACASLARGKHRPPSTNGTTQSYITIFNGACESLETAIRALPLEDR